MVRFHDPLFKTHLKGTRLVGEVTGVRFLSPTVALMHAVGGTVMREESKASPAFHRKNFAGTMWWLLTDWLWKFARPRP